MVGKILAIQELENSPINGPGPIPKELCLHFKRVATYKIKPIWKIRKGEVTKTLPSISQRKFCFVEWKGFAQKFGVKHILHGVPGGEPLLSVDGDAGFDGGF